MLVAKHSSTLKRRPNSTFGDKPHDRGIGRPRDNARRATLSPDAMYAAVRRRDASFIGQFVVAVRTTGVFCRPGCPAKMPLRPNCEFFATPTDALRAGFRACKRCRPMDEPTAAPTWARGLLERLKTHPDRPLAPDDVRRLGIHPSTASRLFKDQFGCTLQEMSRAQRVAHALDALHQGETMLAAIERSGFDSDSGLRKACEELFGTTPADAARQSFAPLIARWLTTPLGAMLAVAADEGLCLLEFVDRRMMATNIKAVRARLTPRSQNGERRRAAGNGRGRQHSRNSPPPRPIVAGDHVHIRQIERELREYFAGERRSFETPLRTAGTPFQERVWAELRRIPCGRTRSYADIASAIGRPTAVRAVARANGDNRLAIMIPCHRVIGSDGQLVGYGGGLWRKRRLLEIEGASVARPMELAPA